MTKKMVALVIGNGAYPTAALINPTNDAKDVSHRLTTYGFNVIFRTDAKNKMMDKALKEFRDELKDSNVALFFFAGHGVQVGGSNYLLAVDSDTDDEVDAKHSSLSLDKVIEVLEKSSASTKIVILDACRTNPWERAWHRSPGTRGLASVYAPKGTIIGFATSPGQIAYDGTGQNGVYTAALLQHIDSPDTTIEAMFKRVRNTVAADTAGKQVTWEHTSLSGEFFFNNSLGKIITLYPETALADSLFTIDESKVSHKIIKGLKSHNWYRQNDALEMLTPASIKTMREDNLFVLGRNIYQSASGGANVARDFLHSFASKTATYPKKKRKALLDGVLFEIFFDSQGKLRKRIKANLFNDVFEFARVKELKPSFDFVSEALVAANADMYALPGRERPLSITVACKKSDQVYRIQGVYIDGVDVLRAEDDETINVAPDQRSYSRWSSGEFERNLSEDLMVPARLLKVVYTPPGAGAAVLGVPRGYTVAKQ